MIYYKLSEAAGILMVDRRTLNNEILEGRLRASKVGRQWRIAEGDLKSYLDEVANMPVTDRERLAA